MGENVESDLLYDDFQNEDQKEFNNVSFGEFSHFCGILLLANSIDQ
jgi:hypothetical protein